MRRFGLSFLKIMFFDGIFLDHCNSEYSFSPFSEIEVDAG